MENKYNYKQIFDNLYCSNIYSVNKLSDIDTIDRIWNFESTEEWNDLCIHLEVNDINDEYFYLLKWMFNLFRSRRFKIAIEHFNQSIKINKLNKYWYILKFSWLKLLYINKSFWDNNHDFLIDWIIKTLEVANSIDEKDLFINYNLFYFYRHNWEYKNSLEYINKCIKLSNSYYKYIDLKWMLLTDMWKYLESKSTFELLLSIWKSEYDNWFWDLHYTCSYNEDHIKSIITYLDKILNKEIEANIKSDAFQF